jgi:hypothetical protein
MDRRLGPIPHDLKGAESRMKAAPNTVFLQRKLNALENAKTLFFSGALKVGYLLFVGGFRTQPGR